MKISQYIFILFILSLSLNAQSKIDQLNWLQGSWTTEKWGGTAEEYWSPPNGNTVIGMFRLVVDDKVEFTEHFMLSEEEGEPILKLRHFNGDFTGWEEKDEYLTFSFVEMGENYLQLKGLRFELLDTGQLKVMLKMMNKGVENTEEFLFSRM